MNIAAVVILYHPGVETVANIDTYCNQVEKVYVFDNTEQVSIIKEMLLLKPGLLYFHDGKNEGIAARLNTAAQMAVAQGYEWLLMMDQDSSFTPLMIDNYLSCFNQYKNSEPVVMFGVNFEQDFQPAIAGCNPVFTNELITSGTLLNLSKFKKIGLFDENLFIDGVDHEYAIRSLLAGYKMIQFPHIQLSHQLGTLVKRASIKTLFLVKKVKKLHAPLRCYYIYRNNLYLQKKYKNINLVDMQKLNKIAQSTITTNFFYGRNVLKLIHYLLLAKKDFRNNKMGKCAGN
ncbi:MAG: glycosyltransferase [Ferruginibacter sp.]